MKEVRMKKAYNIIMKIVLSLHAPGAYSFSNPPQWVSRIHKGSQTTLWELLGSILHLSQGKGLVFYCKSDGKPFEEVFK